MGEEKQKNNAEVDSSNIFDDFAQDSTLIDEVDKLKKENNKDKIYYFGKAWQVFQTIFWVLFFIFLVLYSYIYIQNNEELKNSNLLDPLCFIFIGDIKNSDPLCSSISTLNNTYIKELDNIKKSNNVKILNILERLYEIENFNTTKEVLFLRDKSKNKLRVLHILEKFDDLKNSFDNIDKQKIQCSSIIIDWEKEILSMSCSAYSAWYEKWLRWFDGSNEDTIKGTSLSIANSFINFIDKQSDIFYILDRQKIFKSESVIWDKSDFTNKTSFTIKLKYNLK